MLRNSALRRRGLQLANGLLWATVVPRHLTTPPVASGHRAGSGCLNNVSASIWSPPAVSSFNPAGNNDCSLLLLQCEMKGNPNAGRTKLPQLRFPVRGLSGGDQRPRRGGVRRLRHISRDPRPVPAIAGASGGPVSNGHHRILMRTPRPEEIVLEKGKRRRRGRS